MAAGVRAAAVRAAPASGTPRAGGAERWAGDIVVDGQNRTVYLFKRDTPGKSACVGACAQNWPPVRVSGKPVAGPGIKASLLGTAARSDSKAQVTYNGHPVYLYVGDNAPAATNGQGVTAFGGAWFAVSPAGTQVTRRSTAGRSNGY